MTSPYIAHTTKDRQRTQSVLEHLTGTAARAAAFADAFGAAQQGALAGMAHDIGKYSDEFQRRIRGASIRVDHATAGALECSRLEQPFASYAVMGHHGGLPDRGGNTDPTDDPTYCARIARACAGKLRPYHAYASEVSLPHAALPSLDRSSPLECAFFIRMLYACLVDADALDTEAFMSGCERERIDVTMDALVAKLDAYCARWFPPKSPLNEKRCAILRQCEAAGDAQAPGLFTLTVPTGGGKTVASLAFALHHARAHGKQRVIYVIPYTSIIEQNAGKFREILGDAYVLEHHSGVLYDVDGASDEADPDTARKAAAVENWDSPIVVTTAVQFFESLFANRSSKCRKLHHIANSVVIFDEAQMLPRPFLRPCVYAIAQLVQHFRVSAVLCTATQPALQGIFREFAPSLHAREICPGLDFADFKRTSFRRAGRLSLDDLGERLSHERQVLCIVNTRKAAREIFDRLPKEGAFHLSTMMAPIHRRAALETIRKRLKDGLTCRVVSTSLIEAGVDVSFPAVYREEAGLDSILQAAGRCNREGKDPAEESIVTIFQYQDTPPKRFSTAIGAGKHALDRYASPDCPEAISAYFSELLQIEGPDALDQKGIIEKTKTFQYRKIAEQFHLIDDETVTVYVTLPDDEENASLIASLREGKRSRELFRQLGQYGVSVYRGTQLHALLAAGDIEAVDSETFVLTHPALYNEVTGLSPEADYGKAEFV